MSALDDAEKRFWSRVDKTPECWIWTGCINSRGYGTIRVCGKSLTTHRFSFLLSNGYLPPSSMDIMHLCDNKRCVRPEHLRVGTRAENINDFIAKGGKYGKIGEKNPAHKITDIQFLEILAGIASGNTKTFLGKKYGIARQSICERIKRYENSL